MSNRNDRDARGYGKVHKRLRARWAPAVARGEVSCARCGGTIAPDAPWDLGHDDHDRGRYKGPEHRGCNRRAGARQRAAKARAGQPQTRKW